MRLLYKFIITLVSHLVRNAKRINYFVRNTTRINICELFDNKYNTRQLFGKKLTIKYYFICYHLAQAINMIKDIEEQTPS